ncbi:MAG: hypothetical protein P8J20_07140 [Novosphingobium sp.]|nr:hypothetical protein [Novosphingobium sp.]
MTSRLLLTLLALLTGLAVQATPAEARLQSARPAQMSAVTALASETRKSIPECLVELQTRSRHGLLTDKASMPLLGVAPIAPVVLIGIDRARE